MAERNDKTIFLMTPKLLAKGHREIKLRQIRIQSLVDLKMVRCKVFSVEENCHQNFFLIINPACHIDTWHICYMYIWLLKIKVDFIRWSSHLVLYATDWSSILWCVVFYMSWAIKCILDLKKLISYYCRIKSHVMEVLGVLAWTD